MPKSGSSASGVLRPAVPRLDGVDLKAAEHVTRRLLQSKMAPPYVRLPQPPSGLPSLTGDFFQNEDPFSLLHPAVNPAWRGTDERSGRPYGVPSARSSRKRQQIVAMVRGVMSLIVHGHTGKGLADSGVIMDLCGGCGHVGLVLASLLPTWEVIVVDAKEFALRVANQRALEAGLSNLKVREMDIGELGIGEKVDVVVALHACGDASDTVLDRAMRVGAAAVVAPCCVGGVVSSKSRGVPGVLPAHEHGDRWDVPRSARYESDLTVDEYRLLVRAADFGEEAVVGDGWRRAAKAIVEGDRMAWAEAMGYHVRLVKMEPMSCSPKNDVLLLWPQVWDCDAADVGSRSVGETFTSKERKSSEGNAMWEPNLEANLALEAVVGTNGLLSGFDAEAVAAVDRRLRAEVCAASSVGEVSFPHSEGPRARKLVHAVAGSLGLHHESVGNGPERHVVVRRTADWPFFFTGYLGFGGVWVENAVRALSARVPQARAHQRAVMREHRAHHITLIAAREIKALPKPLKYDQKELVRRARVRLVWHQPQLMGLGRVVDEKDPENDAYFAIVDWPDAAAFRSELGLPAQDFHITLGFAKRDIHGVPKNVTTMLPP